MRGVAEPDRTAPSDGTAPPHPPPGSATGWRAHYAERDRRRPRTGGLTPDGLTVGALELTDRDGLEGLTMRGLGGHLQVRRTSPYRHVASGEELLVETVDHMLGEIRLPSLAGDWTAGSGTGGAGVPPGPRRPPRSRTRPHRRPVAGPARPARPRHALGQLLPQRWSPRTAVPVHLTVTRFVRGSAVLDTGGGARTGPRRAVTADLFADRPPDTHPMVRRHAGLLDSPDAQEGFTLGLRALVTGLGHVHAAGAGA